MRSSAVLAPTIPSATRSAFSPATAIFVAELLIGSQPLFVHAVYLWNTGVDVVVYHDLMLALVLSV